MAGKNTNSENTKIQWRNFLDDLVMHDCDSFDRVISLPWDSEYFLITFQKASRTRDGGTLYALRKLVLEFTRRACTPSQDGRFAYQIANERIIFCEKKEEMIEQIAHTKLHTFDENSWKWTYGQAEITDYRQTEYCVIDGDCLEAAENLININGLNPVVLNMASDKVPGGEYRGGSGAQEENLFRRTNLLRVLANEDKWYKGHGAVVPPNRFYPLPVVSTIYSPSSFVIRSSEATGYDFLPKPYKVAFIASAALIRPDLDITGRKLTKELEAVFLDKARAVLWTAAVYGHDSVVLSAWGCGAFRNPPRHIAELFKQVLEEDWLKGRFKNVTFAIFDDHNTRGEGNLIPFVDVFDL